MSEIRIERLAAGGDGVGRLEDGRTVFVARSAPGDLVELAHVTLHQRFARGAIGRVVQAGPDRVTPRCAHYEANRCGGCQLQHVAYAAQLKAKAAIVGDALRRIGRVQMADPEVVPSDDVWGYRSKITLTVRARGTVIGFHQLNQPDRIFDLVHCEIADPGLMAVWTVVRANRRYLPPRATQLVLRLAHDGRRHLVVRDVGNEVWQGAKSLFRALDAAGTPATIWWQPEDTGAPGRPARGPAAPRVLAGDSSPYPATAFEQVNPVMGDRVRRHAIDQLGSVEGKHLWDLYAGIGETTGELMVRGASVESVEVEPRAVAHAERGDTRHRTPAVVRHAGRVEDLVDRLRDPDAVITNPPRTGMDERATRAIVTRGPPRVVYVSCDPATLARDVARMAPRYALTGVRAFDLFPHTAHVETVALLEAA